MPKKKAPKKKQVSRRVPSRAPASKSRARPLTAPAPLAGSVAAQQREVEYLVRRRIEDVAQGFVSLASELWIVKDRMAVLEQLLAQHGIPASPIDEFEPGGAFKAQLDQARREFARRVIDGLFPRGMPKAD